MVRHRPAGMRRQLPCAVAVWAPLLTGIDRAAGEGLLINHARPAAQLGTRQARLFLHDAWSAPCHPVGPLARTRSTHPRKGRRAAPPLLLPPAMATTGPSGDLAKALSLLSIGAEAPAAVEWGQDMAAASLAGMDDVMEALREVRAGWVAGRVGGYEVNLSSCLLLPACVNGHCHTLHLQALSWPARYACQAAQLGVRWPKGLLLHGPPGCGKTAAVHAVAHECGAAVHLITASSVVGAFTGGMQDKGAGM